MKDTNTIVVDKREADYIAYAQTNKGIWDCGPTRSEAIGNLIRSHRDFFGIKIEMKGNA